MGVAISREEGATLEVNLGCPIVTNGDVGYLWLSCVIVHEPIELSFGVVSRVGPGIGVLVGGPRAPRGG